MEEKKQRGGHREGSGRPITDLKMALSVRISHDAYDKLNKMTNNKSEFIDKIIKKQYNEERT